MKPRLTRWHGFRLEQLTPGLIQRLRLFWPRKWVAMVDDWTARDCPPIQGPCPPLEQHSDGSWIRRGYERTPWGPDLCN